MAELSRIDTRKTTYKGDIINGYLNENYRFIKGTIINISAAFINAKNIKSAVNALLKKIGLPIYKYMDDLQIDIDNKYIHVEIVDYYDTESNKKYAYYVSVTYAE